jgi:chromosome segregation ATPase
MEEAAEVVWGRFLEAENASEVLMGISKEMVGRLQIFQFTLNGSIQREDELSSKLQVCIKQLDAKDTVIKKLESSIAEHIARSSQVPILMEKVKSLEEQLKKSELRLQNANALNAESQEHLSEMENLVESLKESVYEAETRAENAETKVTQLTDTNVELVEEINFLKGSRDSSTKKVTVLEKQLRESEIQLQHAKASSEASQEQQNMLYTAIWDMETLIDDLKSKVSKAESKTDGVEEQCIVLSESNMELNKEISFLRSRVNALEMCLHEANESKAAKAKEIIVRTELIMATVMQLTRERERIQNQV